MTVGSEWLEADDAVELGELLGFVGRWLADDDQRLAESLSRFVGSDGYDIDELRGDLSRFALLLGGDDGASLLNGDER